MKTLISIKSIFSQKTHFFVNIEISQFIPSAQLFWPAGGRKTLTPSQGYGLGRGNGGNSPNFTENGDFSEISGNGVNLVNFTENEKNALFRPKLRMSP